MGHAMGGVMCDGSCNRWGHVCSGSSHGWAHVFAGHYMGGVMYGVTHLIMGTPILVGGWPNTVCIITEPFSVNFADWPVFDAIWNL